MLTDVLPHLACPVCRQPLGQDAASLVCPDGHRFDVARQGYVALLRGGSSATGDTAEMVAARAQVQAAGHFVPVAAALTDVVRSCRAGHGPRGRDEHPLVLDLGAGTGYYLAAVLDGFPGVGLAVDVSRYAARRAARCHPRAAAVVADAWRELPVQDSTAAAVLNVFAPRRGPEVARVLRDDGVLACVVPQTDHLGELVEPLGLLRVDDGKASALVSAMAPHLRHRGTRPVRYQRDLSHDDVRRLVGMGPSAWHTHPARSDAVLGSWPAPVRVTFAVDLLTFERDTR